AQSVTVAASRLGMELANTPYADPGLAASLALTAVDLWAVGLPLCRVSVIDIGVGLLRHRVGPRALDGPYWVTMGAMAVTSVRVSRIVDLGQAPLLEATRVLI